MDVTLYIVGATTVIGSLLKIVTPLFVKTRPASRIQPQYIELGEGDAPPPDSGGPGESPEGAKTILWLFAALVALFGIISLIRYWDALRRNQDSLYFAAWLFVFMVAGMFVQVLATNYRAGRPLFAVTRAQLLFPLLFSIVVFYPVWAIGASAAYSFFSVHAAFLNGYFWESVVSTASPPKPK